MGNLVDKIKTHPDCSRKNNKALVRNTAPFPDFKLPIGESVEICFAFACQSLRCLNPTRCRKFHLNARSPELASATRDNVAGILEWLDRDGVKARLCLSAEARALPCFK